MLKKILLALGLVLLLAVAGVFWYLDRLMPAGAGLTAKHLCSLVHVSGLPLERARALYIDPWLESYGGAISARVEGDAVVARALWRTARAEHRQGLGCTLPQSDAPPLGSTVDRPPRASQSRRATSETVSQRFDVEALEAAVAIAFSEQKVRNTMALLVQHRGEIVAERYAQGITAETPLPGWSMTKSVTATLVGALVREGRLDVGAAGALKEWRGTNDPRAAITLNHLLRMTSGLAITEDQTGADPNSEMLFERADGAAFAATRELVHPPGTHFEYMSGSTVLAMRRAQEVLGGTLEAGVRALDRELFVPLGLPSAVMEPDASGTLVGSSFMLASASDWAQIGQLYLQEGVWGDQRILPIGWREYVTEHTGESATSGYGAGFWLPAESSSEHYDGLPADTFTMDGFQGQFVIIIPSEDLVVVRLGASPIGSRWPEVVKAVLAARANDEATGNDAESAGSPAKVAA